MKKSVVKLFKIISITIGILITVITATASIILFTPTGTSLVRWVGNSYIDGLHIESAQGALLFDPRFEKVTFSGYGVDVNADLIHLVITPQSMLDKQLVIDTLNLRGATISYQAPNIVQEQQESSNNTGKIKLPISILVNNIVLDNISLQALGNKMKWQHFTSAFSIEESVFTLKPTLWQQLNVTLAKSKQKATEKGATKTSNSLISLPKIVLPLDIDIQDFRLETFALHQQGAEKPQLEVHEFGIKLQGHDSHLNIHALNLDMPQIQLNSNVQVSLDNNYPLDLLLNAKIKQKELENHQIEIKAKGDLENLQSEILLQGTLQAKLVSTVNLLNANLPFSLQLSSKQLGFPLQTLSDYRIENTSLSAQGSLDTFKFDLKANTLGKQAPHTDIQLNGSGAVKASGDWRVAFTQFDIDGDYKKMPLDITGRLKASNTDSKIALETQGLHIAHGTNKVILTGNIDDKYDLNLRMDVPKLAASIPQTNGSIYGNVAVKGELTAPKLNLDIKAKKLAYQKNSQVKDISIKGNVSATMPKKGATLPHIDGELNINASDVHMLEAGVEIDALHVAFKGTETSHQLNLEMKGKPVGLNLVASGNLDEKRGWSGVLSSGEILTSEGDWTLSQRTKVEYQLKNSAVNIDAHCWRSSPSQICLKERLSFIPKHPGKARLALNDFSLKMLDAFLPAATKLKGNVNANINTQWNAKLEPNLDAVVNISKGHITQQLDQPLRVDWNKVVLDTKLKNRKMTANLLVDLAKNGNINLDVVINNIMAKRRKMHGRLQISPLSIAFLSPVLGENVSLKGVVNSDISISGTVKKPTFTGGLYLKDYQLSGDEAPIHINTGMVNIKLNKTQGTLDGLLKTDEGELLLTGDANWRDLRAWITHFNIKGEELKVIPKSGMSIVLSPDLTLSVSSTDADIAGTIKIPWARIKVKDVPKGAVSITSDQQILDRNLQVVKEEKAPPLNIKTDIRVEVDKNVKLQAFGLSAFLQGGLHITQVDKKPNIDGDINLVHGTYQAFGQDLEIVKGAIIFSGPPSQPYVDVQAIRNPDTVEDDVTAGINVIGPASDLEINIFSDPSMEQANALSYILRGRGLGSDGGDAGMTSALIGLGLAQSGELIGGIGNALGIQDMSLDTEGEGDNTAVAVSGYITPDLQLKYGVGLFSPIGEFTVKYRLMKKLYVQAVTGIDNAADLLYQFSFD